MLPDSEQFLRQLDQFGLGDWRPRLESLLEDRLSLRAHGDVARWRAALVQLPQIRGASELGRPIVRVTGDVALDAAQSAAILDLLLQLSPWRKGPFDIHGIRIDTEWRSNLKWDRLSADIDSLAGRRVLDVGCGNGYFALRMRGAGAACIVGIDPTLLFVHQFLALNHFIDAAGVAVLPLRLHELPEPQVGFDTTFSMGVLYHQREPLDHLQQLRRTLRPGGQLVLETLILPGAASQVQQPEARYARMRNVWHLPTVQALIGWLEETGFRDVKLIDVTPTTVDEQRTTEWMPFESLAEALDPEDPARTIEGWPAPTRAVVLARTAAE